MCQWQIVIARDIESCICRHDDNIVPSCYFSYIFLYHAYMRCIFFLCSYIVYIYIRSLSPYFTCDSFYHFRLCIIYILACIENCSMTHQKICIKNAFLGILCYRCFISILIIVTWESILKKRKSDNNVS